MKAHCFICLSPAVSKAGSDLSGSVHYKTVTFRWG